MERDDGTVSMVSAGGLNANYILSEQIKDKFCDNGNIITPLLLAISYVLTYANQFECVWNSLGSGNYPLSKGNDIKSYIEGINSLGRNDITNHIIYQSTFIDLLNPYLFFACYGILYSIFTGQDTKIPTIKFGDIGYLPYFKLILARYGLEYKLSNNFYYQDKYYQINLHYGKHNIDNIDPLTSGMIELKGLPFKLGELPIGIDLAIYRQPSLMDEKGKFIKKLNDAIVIGGKLSFNTSIKVADGMKLKLSCGYKTNGFLLENAYKDGMFFTIGFNLC